MSNHSSFEYIEQFKDETELETTGHSKTLNSANQDSKPSSTNSSILKSPKAKKVKMVHASLSADEEQDINEVYLEQLSIMKSRVSLLDVSNEDHNTRLNSAPVDSNIIHVKPAECIENMSNTAESPTLDDHFDESTIYSNLEDGMLSNRNSLTPRMLEVPPKKVCVRLKTPNFAPTENQNETFRSLSTETKIANSTIDKSTNTEGIWIRVSLEDIPNTIKSKSHIDPRVMIHKSSSNTSRTSFEDAKLETASNITSIETPDLQISPCSQDPYTNITSGLFQLSGHHRTHSCNSLVNAGNDITSQEKYSSNTELIQTLTPVRSTSSDIKKLFKNNVIVPCPNDSVQEPSDIPEVMEMQCVHDSDYNLPLKNLGERDSYSIVKDVVSNLALHFFKSKDKISDPDEIALDTSIEEKVSFRALAEEVPDELTENEKKVQAIRRILTENIENFRSKNVYATRRPQATEFRYYSLHSGVHLEIGAGENILRPDSLEDVNAIQRAESENEEEEESPAPPGCCSLKACAEFMFPKREPKFFD